jgi:hypothetical protein
MFSFIKCCQPQRGILGMWELWESLRLSHSSHMPYSCFIISL